MHSRLINQLFTNQPPAVEFERWGEDGSWNPMHDVALEVMPAQQQSVMQTLPPPVVVLSERGANVCNSQICSRIAFLTGAPVKRRGLSGAVFYCSYVAYVHAKTPSKNFHQVLRFESRGRHRA